MADSFDDMLDSALGDVLSSGWNDEPARAETAAPEYPPLPVRQAEAKVKSAIARVKGAPPAEAAAAILATTIMAVDEIPVEDDAEDDQDDDRASFGIGLLTDLATGRKTPQEAADAAGLPLSSLQDALATELRDSSADDIAKALAIQASEQQLKSGAIYGAVLFDLVRDMAEGRLQPKEKIKFAELLSAVGKIMPKEDRNVGAGGGFVLNISLGNVSEKPVIIDAD